MAKKPKTLGSILWGLLTEGKKPPHYTIRSNGSGSARITTREKRGNSAVTLTTGGGKKSRSTTTTRVGNRTYTQTKIT
jgi:hypothetical protein